MLIRSQDKKSLYNISTNKGLWITARAKGVTVVAEGLGDIGQYSTEAKAIKVLDMIQDAYTPTPKEIQLYIDGILPKIALTNTVFQMPTDTEVEI